ncbi:hypothetical protein TNCV_2402501 [Trichonephila clavipes]|nr:hypothetical protein TNCV_2402501 [Trichonephila clavipes]
MGTPTARNVAPAGSEYAETVRSNHCSKGKGIYHIKEHLLAVFPVGLTIMSHEEFGTVIEDDNDTNINSEKELTL